MSDPEARLQVLGDFTDDNVIKALTHLPPGLRENLILTPESTPEAYDVARQSLSTSGFGDE
eukprot:8406877-Prorocentrum_lima.AAC.1